MVDTEPAGRVKPKAPQPPPMQEIASGAPWWAFGAVGALFLVALGASALLHWIVR